MTPPDPTSRRRPALTCLVVVLVALAVRLAAIVALDDLAPRVNDRVLRYDPIALSLLAGEGFSHRGNPTTSSPPVYPLFLAAVYGVFGHSERAARAALAVVDAGMVGLVFLLGRRLFGDLAGLVAAIGATFLPYSIVQIVMGGSDILFLFLHTLFLAVFVQAWLSGGKRHHAAAGALLGVATLCRAVPLLLPVALVALLLAAGRGTWRRRALRATLLALAFVAVITPWIVRNWVVFDRFIPVQTLGGMHLFMATIDPETSPRDGSRRWRPKSGDQVENDRQFFVQAAQRIAENPASYARQVGRRQIDMWSRTHSGRYESWLLAANSLLLALAAAGVVLSRDRWRLLPLLGVLAYYVALHSVLLAIFRYMLPVVPVLLLLASVAVAAALPRRLVRRLPGIADEAPSASIA